MNPTAHEEVALESTGPGGSLHWTQDAGGHWRAAPANVHGYFDVIPVRGGGFHTWFLKFMGDRRTVGQAVDLGQHSSLGAAFGAARDFLDSVGRKAAEESTPRVCGCPADDCAHRHPPTVPTTACAKEEGDPSAMPVPGELPMVKVVAENPAAFKAALEAAEAMGPIDTPAKAYQLLAGTMNQSDQEQLVVVCLNLHGKVLGIAEVNRGERESVNASIVQIMRTVLNVHGASAFFIAHNHPTGKAKPSKSDRDLTTTIKDACKPYRELAFVDHIVIGQGQFYSIEEQKRYKFKR